jgi:hypothetical protein
LGKGNAESVLAEAKRTARVRLAKSYLGRKRYVSIAFPGPALDFLVDITKTYDGLRPDFL